MTRGGRAGILHASQPLDEAGRARLLEQITAPHDLFVTLRRVAVQAPPQ
jgi:hypothetical protein